MRIIRPMNKTDVPPISELEAKSFSMPWSAEAFMDLIADECSLYLVAEEDGVLVGCCGVTNILGEGNINNVVVDEDYRGRGIATDLLRELFVYGGKMGIKEYTLEVRVSNAPAIHVYEKMGFVSEGIRPKFYEKPIEDAMIMWKR